MLLASKPFGRAISRYSSHGDGSQKQLGPEKVQLPYDEFSIRLCVCVRPGQKNRGNVSHKCGKPSKPSEDTIILGRVFMTDQNDLVC